MATRHRLLIYNGDPEWIAEMKAKEWVREGETRYLSRQHRIDSVDLSEDEVNAFINAATGYVLNKPKETP